MPLETDSLEWHNQLSCLQKDIELFKQAQASYDSLQERLAGNEHLIPIYEPSARRLVELTQQNILAQLAQISPNVHEEISKIDSFAKLSGADTLDIQVNTPPELPSGLIDMGLLGKILSDIQTLIYTIIKPSKSKTTALVKDYATLYVNAFAPGSFSIRAQERKQEIKLFEKHAVSSSLPTIIKLMDSATNPDQLKSVIDELDLLVVSKYSRLLRALKTGDCGLALEWASPEGETQRSSLSANSIKEIVAMFDREIDFSRREVTVYGRLVMLEKDEIRKRGKFKLQSFDDIVYSGTADESFIGFYIPSDVEAVLEERIEINETTEEESISYRLLAVEPYETK